METLYRAGLSNAVSATVLALVVACLGRVLGRRPAVLHCLWLLVLLKLVTPPLYEVSIPWPEPVEHGSRDRVGNRASLFWSGNTSRSSPANSDDVVLELLAGFQHPPRPAPGSAGRPQRSHDMPSIDWMRLACLIWIAGSCDDAGRLDRANPPVSACSCAKPEPADR